MFTTLFPLLAPLVTLIVAHRLLCWAALLVDCWAANRNTNQ